MREERIHIAVEELLLWDIVMDVCILACVQLALDRIRPKRLLRAMLPLRIAGYLCVLLDLNPALMQLIVCPLSGAALLGQARPVLLLRASGVIFASYAAAGGCVRLVGGYIPLLIPMLCLFALLLRRQNHISFRWNIGLLVEKNGRSAYLAALIDTGNRLYCRRRGLPVVIAQADALRQLTDCIEPEEYTALPYSVIGSGGELNCFCPDDVHILLDGRRFPAPECMIALSPGRIPGCINALAPPGFADCIGPHYALSERIQYTCRRFQYGFFKHKAIHLWHGRSDPQGIGVLYRRKRHPSAAADP